MIFRMGMDAPIVRAWREKLKRITMNWPMARALNGLDNNAPRTPKQRRNGSVHQTIYGKQPMVAFQQVQAVRLAMAIYPKQLMIIIHWLQRGALNGLAKICQGATRPKLLGNVHGAIYGKRPIVALEMGVVVPFVMADCPKCQMIITHWRRNEDFAGWAQKFLIPAPKQFGNVRTPIVGNEHIMIYNKEADAPFVLEKPPRFQLTIMPWPKKGDLSGWGLKFLLPRIKHGGNVVTATDGRPDMMGCAVALAVQFVQGKPQRCQGITLS